jgi:branched-subunit amino acid transport protein
MILAVFALGVGTFAFRYAGPVLRDRLELSANVERLVGVAAVVLLAALVATSALFDAAEFAGFARPAGVVVGGALAWRRAPFIVVVVAAAATAALLRLLGLP